MMNKTIVISEEIAKSKQLNEAILLSQLPLDIQQALEGGTTPLSKNPALPNPAYLTDITLSELLKRKKEINKWVCNLDEVELSNLLSQLIKETQEIERPIRENLEKLCYEEVSRLFNVPAESVDFTIDLVDYIDDAIIQDVPIEPQYNEDYAYRDGDDIGNIELEISKREIINTLSMGSALYYTDQILKHLDIDGVIITQELIDNYCTIVAINTYLLYTKDDIGITDKNSKQIGFTKVKLGDNENKNFIISKGIVFPVLLTETIKGYMEIFSSHGLPPKRELAELILSKTDFIKAEPWHMRLGSPLWKKIIQGAGLYHSAEVPYFFMKLCQLPVMRFNELMKEIFNNTPRAKKIVAPVISKAKHDVDKEKFNQRIKTKQYKQGLIKDQKYIKPEEL